MGVVAYQTVLESCIKTVFTSVEVKCCSVCEQEYIEPLYIHPQSMGGSCITCRNKYMQKCIEAAQANKGTLNKKTP